MAIVRMDPIKAGDLIRKYRPDAVSRPGAGGTEEILFSCPFHPDSRPSFSFNTTKGAGICFSCGKGGSLSALVAQFEGKTEDDVKKIVIKAIVQEETPEGKRGQGRPRKLDYAPCKITMEEVEEKHAALLADAKMLADIQLQAGWNRDLVEHFKIGKDTVKGYWIPLIYNGIVVNIKHYLPNGKPKYWGEDGANDNILWPLENAMKHEQIWLMEGEKDCMRAIMLGLNAVTFTGGAKSISRQFLRYFKDKDVCICYDIDDAGQGGAARVANILYKVAASVKIIDLPPEKMKPNGDFSDFISIGGQVDQLTQAATFTESHKGDNIATKIAIPDEVADTYLEEILVKKLFFRRVRMHVRVVSVGDGKAFVVPKDLRVACAKDWKEQQCISCPMNFQEDNELEMVMRHHHPEILSVVDGNDKKQREAIRTMMEIPLGCPRFKIEFRSHQALYPIVIIPALEKNKHYHSYTMHTAWALDVPAVPNEDYLAEAVVMSNPETQGLAIICYKLDRDLSSVDEFELDEEMYKSLEVFKCSPATISTEGSPQSTTISALTSPRSTEDTTST